jgi:hypothetical protein
MNQWSYNRGHMKKKTLIFYFSVILIDWMTLISFLLEIVVKSIKVNGEALFLKNLRNLIKVQ